jgi:hypothetical protein
VPWWSVLLIALAALALGGLTVYVVLLAYLSRGLRG